MIRKKATARERYLKNATDCKREKFNSLRIEVKRAVKESRESYFSSLGTTLKDNPKGFWSIFKIKSKSGNSMPRSFTGKDHQSPGNRVHANNPYDIAKLFNEYFYSVYNPPSDVPSPTVSVSHHVLPIFSTIELTVDEVCKELQSLDAFKATGPDGIPSRILKECAPQLAESLCLLFNKSLRLSQIPNDWKLANIFPLFKKGKKDEVENYRPISLLSIIGKVLERVVFNRLYSHIQSLIHSAQHGFVNGKSVSSQLLSVLHTIGKNLDDGKQTDVVFMDISKAFDSVDHPTLIRKLQDFGISGSLLLWFENYLSGRFQQVTIQGAISDQLPITSGVPQGSILGPLLFLVYVNEIPNYITASTNIAVFADDTKCFKTIQSSEDAASLQGDIVALESWARDHRLNFNIPKCKVLSITRKKVPVISAYKLDGDVINHISVESDLGVKINSSLNWKDQTNEVRSKANRILGLIRRTTMEMDDIQAKKLLYLQLVRSNFSHASQAWCPQSIDLISNIEKVQRRATKFILNLGFFTDISYQKRLIKLNLLPVTYWHEYLDMVMLFKIMNGLVSVSHGVHFSAVSSRKTRSSSDDAVITLVIPFAKTVTFQTSYFIRSTKVWNILDTELRIKQISLNSFKIRLKKYYYNALSNVYDIENPRTWKSVCVKCKRARSLVVSASCCF